MRTGYLVVVAMLLVVMSFAVSLAYSHYLVQGIDERALAISKGSVPRFRRISMIRRDLLITTTLTNEHLGRAALHQAATRQAVDASLGELRAQVVAYCALPASAEEQPDLHALGAELAPLTAAVDAAMDEADANQHDAAVMVFRQSVQPRVLRMDGILERLRSFQQRSVEQATQEILDRRRNAEQVATLLGLVSLGTAIAATALVLQGLRAQGRLVAERDRLLTERAAELELFAGRVAHDLRDPLNAVGLRLAALRSGPVPAAAALNVPLREGLDRISVQLERMRGSIDGLLEFARAGAHPSAEAADLGGVLDEVLTSVRPAAEAAQIDVQVAPLPDVRLALAPAALGSVLANLLGNAVKYVGEGEQLPHWIRVRVSPHAGWVRIEVEDNGPGLPPGAEQRVFEPFQRLKSQQPGTGLGLATVKKIVEAYRGRVGVIADLGRGSTFWVEIPVRESRERVLTRSDTA